MATIHGSAAGGNWDATTSWTEGAVPTSGDDVILNNAGVTSGSITINATASCRSLDCTSFTNTLTHNTGIALNIGDGTAGAGNVAIKFVGGMTYTRQTAANAPINFVSTSGTVQTLTFASKTTGGLTFNGAGGSWQCADSINEASGSTTTLTNGTLDLNNNTASFGHFSSSNANTRTLTCGSSTITINASAGSTTLWDFATTTGLTFNANTSEVRFQLGAGGPWTVATGGKTFNNVTLTGTSTAAFTFTGAATIATLTLDTASAAKAITLPASTTTTCTTLSASGASGKLITIRSSSAGTQATLSVSGSSTAQFCDVKDNAATGAGTPINDTNGGINSGNNSGWLFPGGGGGLSMLGVG